MRPGARDACARPSSDRRAPWITAAARAHGEFGVDVIDLRDWELPLFGETFATVGDPRNPTFSVPAVKRWNAKIAEGDAYLFISPEYNHSVPAVLKNAIDSVFATFAIYLYPERTGITHRAANVHAAGRPADVTA